MIRFTYGIGNRVAFAKLASLKGDTESAIRKAWYFIGKDLRNDARKYILQGPKSGKIYTVFKNGRPVQHQASAPGESPANLTGLLRSSIDFLVRGFRNLEFGSSAPYAKYLDGSGSTQFPDSTDLNRPFLKRAIIANQQNAINHFGSEIQKAINRLTK